MCRGYVLVCLSYLFADHPIAAWGLGAPSVHSAQWSPGAAVVESLVCLSPWPERQRPCPVFLPILSSHGRGSAVACWMNEGIDLTFLSLLFSLSAVWSAHWFIFALIHLQTCWNVQTHQCDCMSPAKMCCWMCGSRTPLDSKTGTVIKTRTVVRPLYCGCCFQLFC